MSDNEQRRHYEFTKDETFLLKETVEGEIRFCEKQIQLAKEDKETNIYIRDRVIRAYRELIEKYVSILPRLTWGVEC